MPRRRPPRLRPLRSSAEMYSSRGWSYSPSPTASALTASAYRRRRLRAPRIPRVRPLPIAVTVGALFGADGRFSLDGVKPPEAVSLDAPGYGSASVRVLSPFQPIVATLEPIAVDLFVSDAETGQPVGGVTVVSQQPA